MCLFIDLIETDDMKKINEKNFPQKGVKIKKKKNYNTPNLKT